ncbi:hypothetical protein ACC862_38030, partial [Rhizobium ruizarguesonis]
TGSQLSWGDQILLLLVAMRSSKGAAGITGAVFITLAATLSVVPSVPVAVSSSFSQRATTIVATALTARLVSARHSDMKRA